MLESNVVERIRSIFLHPQSRVTVTCAAKLLGWHRREMRAAIKAQEVAVVDTCAGAMVELSEIFAKAIEAWPLVTIEDALGADAVKILPPATRSRRVTARLSRYQIATLEYLASHGYLSVDACLSRAVDDLASAHAEELAACVPGFAEAFDWPARAEWPARR